MFVNSHPHLGTGDGEHLRPTPKAASVQMPTPKADSIQFSEPSEQGMNSLPVKACTPMGLPPFKAGPPGPPGPPQAGPPLKRLKPSAEITMCTGYFYYFYDLNLVEQFVL